jgi:hypothetical protein
MSGKIKKPKFIKGLTNSTEIYNRVIYMVLNQMMSFWGKFIQVSIQ